MVCGTKIFCKNILTKAKTCAKIRDIDNKGVVSYKARDVFFGFYYKGIKLQHSKRNSKI